MLGWRTAAGVVAASLLLLVSMPLGVVGGVVLLGVDAPVVPDEAAFTRGTPRLAHVVTSSRGAGSATDPHPGDRASWPSVVAILAVIAAVMASADGRRADDRGWRGAATTPADDRGSRAPPPLLTV